MEASPAFIRTGYNYFEAVPSPISGDYYSALNQRNIAANAVPSPISGDYYSTPSGHLNSTSAVPSPISGDYYSKSESGKPLQAAVPSPISGDYYSVLRVISYDLRYYIHRWHLADTLFFNMSCNIM